MQMKSKWNPLYTHQIGPIGMSANSEFGGECEKNENLLTLLTGGSVAGVVIPEKRRAVLGKQLHKYSKSPQSHPREIRTPTDTTTRVTWMELMVGEPQEQGLGKKERLARSEE